MKNIAVFASGSGSDLQSVIDSCESGEINGRVRLVVTNKPLVGALDRAKSHGIESVTFKLSDYQSHAERDTALLKTLEDRDIDLIVLAGYLSIVTEVIIKPYERRIINIHPSLIPRHCGNGFYGIKVHESVIASGDKVSGATVHYVDGGADTGEILEQVTVEVLQGDTAEALQKRVLEQEHILLPKVVARLCK